MGQQIECLINIMLLIESWSAIYLASHFRAHKGTWPSYAIITYIMDTHEIFTLVTHNCSQSWTYIVGDHNIIFRHDDPSQHTSVVDIGQTPWARKNASMHIAANVWQPQFEAQYIISDWPYVRTYYGTCLPIDLCLLPWLLSVLLVVLYVVRWGGHDYLLPNKCQLLDSNNHSVPASTCINNLKWIIIVLCTFFLHLLLVCVSIHVLVFQSMQTIT